jgi:DNA helicase HerA-like ATPase
MFQFFKDKIPTPSARSLNVAKGFAVSQQEFAATGERDAILASSGMGKSYLTGVLMEETLENGGLLCVIDPEGEHFTLAEKWPMMIVGGEHGNLPLEEDALDLYVDAMLQHGFSAIFDLSEYLDTEQQQVYCVIVDKIFQAEQKYRRKIRLVVEEAQIYAPQRMASAPTKGAKAKGDPVLASQKIAKRGRKRAIDSLWATQRPASISKDILSQCNRFWFGGITSEQDYKAIKPFLTEAGISFADIRSLQPGEFYYYGKGYTRLIKVRKRMCKHAGATPEAGFNFSAASNSTLSQALSKLSEEISRRTVQKAEEQSEVKKLKTVIRELEDEVRKLKQELQQERLATKVIERLGSAPPETSTRRGSRKKLGFEALDELDAADKPEKIMIEG